MEEVVAGWLDMCVMGWVGVGGGSVTLNYISIF